MPLSMSNSLFSLDKTRSVAGVGGQSTEKVNSNSHMINSSSNKSQLTKLSDFRQNYYKNVTVNNGTSYLAYNQGNALPLFG